MPRSVTLPDFKKYQKKVQEVKELGPNKFEIPRYMGYEAEMNKLVELITGNSEGYKMAGCEYENDTFLIRPYYFGSCICSTQKLIVQFKEQNEHSKECFHSHWLDIKERFEEHKEYFHSNVMKAHRLDSEMRLCSMFKIPWNSGKDLDKICTCDYKNKLQQISQEFPHDPKCPTISPNFTYKPDVYNIWWYKVYFRDSYSNVPLDLPKFQSIIRKCMPTVRRK
jgi:hypothetical protein